MCAHAVRVAVNKIDGVAEVTVSLNAGLAVIGFRPDNRVTVEQVRRAIRDNGFTPKGAEVRVRGTVVTRDGGYALATPADDSGFVLAGHETAGDAPLGDLLGEVVIVQGTVPEDPGGKPGRPRLAVRRIGRAPGS